MRPQLAPVPADTAVVASPCVSICAMDVASSLCVGCLRTLQEIACWSALDADGKRAILAQLPARREHVAAPVTAQVTVHDSERN